MNLPVPILSQLQINEFWNHVSIIPDECWEWIGAKNKDGYGNIIINGVNYRAHRVAYAISNDYHINDDLMVLHDCDNPPCCNPEHLFQGTQKDNMQDAAQKGKHKGGARYIKYSYEMIEEIREKFDTGLFSQAQLCKMYDMPSQHMSRIVNYQARKR